MIKRKFACIVCIDNLNAIGYENKLMYNIKEDLQIFRDVTLEYKNMIMGKKTFDSLPKVLDNRVHYVLTHDQNIQSFDENVKYINSPRDVLDLENAIVIGGSEIYKLFEEYYNRMFITHIDINPTEYDRCFTLCPVASGFTPVFSKRLESYKDCEVYFTLWQR